MDATLAVGLAGAVPSDRSEPTWAAGARRAVIRCNGHDLEVLVADTSARRRTGWSHAPVVGAPIPVIFAFDVDRHHAFWMRDVAFDLDLLHLDHLGCVIAIHAMTAGSATLVAPPEPARYALELAAQEALRLGLRVGQRFTFDPADVAPIVPDQLPEPAIDPDRHDDPALVERWTAREHFYASRPFAAAAGVMGWQMRVAPHDVAIWLHAGGGFVIHPPRCPLAALDALARSLGLTWLRLELAPTSRLVLADGSEVIEPFDPRDPDDWLARMRVHGLYPTTGRWQQTRTLVVDLSGSDAELLSRLPTRIRYEARAFSRAVAAGTYRVEAVPAAALDERQERAFMALHEAWLATHPDAEDNLAFCRPMAHAYGAALTAYLCWRGADLVAVQFHVLWRKSLYYLFSEAVAGAPQGITPGLLWHGICAARATPFGPSEAPDLLDLVGAFDPRYPDFRAFGRGFTASKQRWHPTSVWLPPAVAFPGMEMPP